MTREQTARFAPQPALGKVWRQRATIPFGSRRFAGLYESRSFKPPGVRLTAPSRGRELRAGTHAGDRSHRCIPCPSPKPRPATRGFEFGSAAWLHGEQNGAEARKDRAMPASLPA